MSASASGRRTTSWASSAGPRASGRAADSSGRGSCLSPAPCRTTRRVVCLAAVLTFCLAVSYVSIFYRAKSDEYLGYGVTVGSRPLKTYTMPRTYADPGPVLSAGTSPLFVYCNVRVVVNGVDQYWYGVEKGTGPTPKKPLYVLKGELDGDSISEDPPAQGKLSTCWDVTHDPGS